MCECLRELPDTVIDKILADDFSDSGGDDGVAIAADDVVAMMHGIFTRCYLIGCGSQPLTLLNYVIEAALTLSNE